MNSDRGVVTAFVLGLVLAFVLLAGLAVDSGRLVAAHVTAGDHAENAARAGAQEVTLVRLGWRLVDPRRATATARARCSAAPPAKPPAGPSAVGVPTHIWQCERP